MRRMSSAVASAALMLLGSVAARAQSTGTPPAEQQGAPVALTLKSAIGLALRNSKDIEVAKIQASLAERSSMITKAEFMPNLYAGSGAGYTYGIPETPGGRAPSVFNVSYTEQVLNEPLRGQAKELQEQVRSRRIALEDVKNDVIARTAMAYLELAKVRHSLELLRKEQVVQRILQLEGREDELEVFLRGQIGLGPEQGIEVTPEELPGEAEQEGANLVALAMQNNTDLLLAQSDVKAKEFRLKGEKRGYWPTLELVSVYSLLSNYNNYSLYFNHFQKNNYNAGVQVQVPVFSPRIKGAINLAQINLQISQAILANKKNGVSADVRQKTRR